MKTLTVGELGPKLPIGFVKDRKLAKDFEIRPYIARIDRFMNLWREANQGRSMAYLVAKFVSLITYKVNDALWALTPEGDSSPELELAIHDWWNADVMYVYFWTRIASLGDKAEVPFSCRVERCGHSCELDVDLRSTEVTVVEDLRELEQVVELRDGLKLRAGSNVRKLRLAPVRFRAMTLPGSGVEGSESMGYNFLREALVGVGDMKEQYVLTDEEIDQISKRDMLAINYQAGRIAAGLKLRTTVNCPKCKAPNKNALDWSFDSFFDSSVPLGELMP